jgi:hypothetical protein
MDSSFRFKPRERILGPYGPLGVPPPIASGMTEVNARKRPAVKSEASSFEGEAVSAVREGVHRLTETVECHRFAVAQRSALKKGRRLDCDQDMPDVPWVEIFYRYGTILVF